MSGSHQSHGGHDAHAAHDDHDAHGHEEALPPEPETPLWLTLAGGVLFVTGGLIFLFMNKDDITPTTADTTAKPAATQMVAPPIASAPVVQPMKGLDPAAKAKIDEIMRQRMKQNPTPPTPVAPIPHPLEPV